MNVTCAERVYGAVRIQVLISDIGPGISAREMGGIQTDEFIQPG